MDIEDAPVDSVRPRTISSVHPRFIKKKNCAEEPDAVGDNIPGTQRIFVQVWGCAHNISDAEYMAGLLSTYGYKVTLGGSSSVAKSDDGCACSDKTFKGANCSNGDRECRGQNCRSPNHDEAEKEAADLWLLNSCTVKGPAEDHFRNAVMAAKARAKKVVVAGCVPQGSPNVAYLKDVSVVGVQQIDRVVEVVEQTLMGNTVRFMEKRVGSDENGLGGSGRKRRLGGAPLSLPKIRRNPLIEILVVSTGCLNACTYCKTKHARGVLASYTVAELVQRAIEAFNDGVREIWLTSEDLGAYGRDLPRFDYHLPTTPATVAEKWPNHLTLADLLFALVPTIPAGCMLRLGMTNPPYILDQLEEVAAVLRHPRVYAFVHIPVQSGSNSVLESMRRAYTVEEFQRVVECLTSGVHSVDGDKLTVATDLICGFPTETEADFQDTVKLVERYKFPVLFINQFFARPGTPAATMKRVATTAEVKKRTRRLHDLFRSYCPFDGRVGRVYRVLITEASTDSKHWVGHTKAYEQILLPKDPDLQGRIVLVEVTECDKFFMRGKVIDRGPFESLSVGEDDGFQLSLQTVGGPARVPEDICHKSTIPKVILSKTKSGFDSSSVILVAVVLLLAAWVIIKFFGSV